MIYSLCRCFFCKPRVGASFAGFFIASWYDPVGPSCLFTVGAIPTGFEEPGFVITIFGGGDAAFPGTYPPIFFRNSAFSASHLLLASAFSSDILSATIFSNALVLEEPGLTAIDEALRTTLERGVGSKLPLLRREPLGEAAMVLGALRSIVEILDLSFGEAAMVLGALRSIVEIFNLSLGEAAMVLGALRSIVEILDLPFGEASMVLGALRSIVEILDLPFGEAAMVLGVLRFFFITFDANGGA